MKIKVLGMAHREGAAKRAGNPYKLGWGALVLAALLIIRSGLLLAVGIAQGFQGAIPWGRFGLFTLISWAVSMMVYALQQGLSLRFVNQAAALVRGISGSFWTFSPCCFLRL